MDIELFVLQSDSGVRLDFAVNEHDLSGDHDLKTAVLVSLFTDRRAEDDDVLPEEGASKRGWWADVFGVVGDGRRIGSRLWLLQREKQLNEVVNRAREYCKEALQWLVDDGVASDVIIDAEVVADGVLGIRVAIHRDKSTPNKFRFDYAWTGMESVRQ